MIPRPLGRRGIADPGSPKSWISRANRLFAEDAVLTLTDKNGSEYYRPNPWITVLEKADKRLMKASIELGMTPASRSKVDVKKKAEKKKNLESWRKKAKVLRMKGQKKALR